LYPIIAEKASFSLHISLKSEWLPCYKDDNQVIYKYC